jgi:hypothetical protein
MLRVIQPGIDSESTGNIEALLQQGVKRGEGKQRQ